MAKRVYEKNVKIKWEDTKVLKQVNNKHELFIVEEIQIYKGKPNATIIDDRQINSLEKPWRYTLNGNMY